MMVKALEMVNSSPSHQNNDEVNSSHFISSGTSIVPYVCTEKNPPPQSAKTEEDDKKHKRRSKNWTRVETLKLIKLESVLEPQFSCSWRKTELWDEIEETKLNVEPSHKMMEGFTKAQLLDTRAKASTKNSDIEAHIRDIADVDPTLQFATTIVTVENAMAAGPILSQRFSGPLLRRAFNERITMRARSVAVAAWKQDSLFNFGVKRKFADSMVLAARSWEAVLGDEVF
ncbi:hypothetical protein SUGI_0751240 [Cryptomeria japonica]|nr:hypothetical protein SUGI_0751240 [Cryptomeria japonica]